MPADPFRDQDGRKADELARALAARREQFLFRLSVALASLLVFNVFTGWPIALAWFAAYAAIQMVERRLLYDLPVGRLTRGRRRTGLAVVAASNAVFSGLGIFEALHGGPWGLVCAVMLWSGSILNGASVGAASRAMVLASNTPPALCLLAAPFLVIYEEAPAAYGLAIVAAGVLNVLAATAIWEISSRLLEAKDAEHQARAIAFGDPETGLPNRMALEQEAALFRPGDDNVYLVALGVDRFNRIRGAIGHELAASLIGEVAGRLGALHSASRVARLSTDTLGLALAAADMDAAKARAAKLQASIAGPMAIGPHTVDVSLTIGIAEMGAAAAAAPGLVEGAAVALDAARAAKQRIACFDATSRVGAVDDLSLMSEMERAIAEDRLSLHYQPKYDLRAGVFVGAEALVRWHHPERGPMLPDAFVPVAEETGHIGALTRWVLAKAIEEQALLARNGHRIHISTNISGLLLRNDDVADSVLELARAATGEIVFEITETAVVDDSAEALRFIERLRAAGIGVSIDDYGSGLSSLAYLRNIPASELKIDKAFILRIAESRRDGLLVRSTVDLAHSLGMKVTAEGVETPIALSLLAAAGCDFAQGFFLGVPMPVGDLVGFLDARAARTDLVAPMAVATDAPPRVPLPGRASIG